MEQVIEKLIDQFLKEICGEGERRIKLQAFSACLEVIRGVRKLFILVYVIFFASFLSALSFFATGYLAVEQWHSGSPNFLDPRLLFSAGLWLASTSLLALTVREKKWISAFGLRERIARLENSYATSPYATSTSAGPSPMSEEALVRLIDRVLEERSKRET